VTKRRRRRRSLFLPLAALAAFLGVVAYVFLRENAPAPRVAERPAAPPPTATPEPRPRRTPRAPRAGSGMPSDFEPAAGKGASLALVVDDLGFDPAALQRLAALPGPLAIAVIPNAPLARQAAALAREKRWDLLVHLPMAGADGSPAETGAIGPSDDDATIASRVARAIDAVPGASGLNNHQGSRATKDARVVRAMLEVVGARGLFFLDSRTTAESVGETEARKLGIPTAARDVFLDDAATEASAPGGVGAALDAAWREALARARRKGSCVLIAHPRKETLDFLAAHLGEAKERVRVSQIVE
jgi:uncharacterized protein